ncbi:MAG: trypsin-like serine protease [Chloroflexaceae bacterium]|nr:trypsin-like serine protease [Chloroflexaceae bacterium]
MKFSHSQQPRSSKTPAGLSKLFTYSSLILLGAGTALGGNYLANRPLQAQTPAARDTQVAQLPAPAPAAANFVIDVVEKVGPAVVRIDSARTVRTQTPDVFRDPAFRRFFGSQIPDPPSEQIQRGTGSGFIVNQDGVILTNAHVIDGADRVTVTLKDGRSFDGAVLGTDSLTDVAAIKIQADNLPTAPIGNSESLRPGEWAIAIGNPLGLDSTVTTGIISATGRTSSQIGAPDKRVAFIQTDAAINPGNSGGPLLNAQGEVIGINTAIIQNAQGLGFAIPINRAQAIAEELIANGKVEHPYLGIQMAALTPQVREQLKAERGIDLPDGGGVLIVGVLPNSPAARAGLQAGDAIASIAARNIEDPSDVQQAVDGVEVGDTLSVEILRDGKRVGLEVQVAALPTP